MSNSATLCERSCSLMLQEPQYHLGSRVRLLVRANILEFNSVVLSVISDILIDSETRVCVHVFIRVSVRAL